MTARIAWIAMLLGLAICSPAHAASRLRLAAPAGEAPLSDGGRWGVIPVTGGMIVLEVHGETVSRRSVALAAPCESQFGTPRGVVGRFVLVECSFRANELRPRLLVYDLAARTGGSGTEARARRGPGPRRPLGRAPHLPLDRPPASRRRLLAYSRQFAVVERGDQGAQRRVVLERCNGRSVTLTRTQAWQIVSLGPRDVVWTQGRTIHARSLRGGGERRWRAPGGKRVVGLVQVGDQLFVTIRGGPNGEPRGFGFTVYRGRLP